jgi:hypothetical protein
MNKIGIYYAYWTHEWDADFHPFIDKVAALGFDLLEVMEPFLMPGGQVGRGIKVFRDLSANLDLDQEAHKAVLFMRGVLK